MTDNECGWTADGKNDPCGLPAGWGTDHVGEGYCRKHGGTSTGGERDGSGAPEDNTNAVTRVCTTPAAT